MRRLIRLAIPLLAAAFAPLVEAEVVFTLVGQSCVPHDAYSHAMVAISPNECRLWCAQEAQCKTVQITFDGPVSMCKLFTSFEDALGTCTMTSCCYYKGVPPKAVNTGVTVLAMDSDERPPHEQMGTQNAGSSYSTISLPLMLCVTSSAILLLSVVSFYVSRKRRRQALRAELASIAVQNAEKEILQQKLNMLPTSICAGRGIISGPSNNTGPGLETNGNQTPPNDAFTAMSCAPTGHARKRNRDNGSILIDMAKRAISVVETPTTTTEDTREEEECALCMAVFEPGEVVRHLPCRHYFHSCCIDRWLLGGADRPCPLCKMNPFAAFLRTTEARSWSSGECSTHNTMVTESPSSDGDQPLRFVVDDAVHTEHELGTSPGIHPPTEDAELPISCASPTEEPAAVTSCELATASPIP
eukprot:scaffold283632_cov33-Tisochrysis_lutea.AAC.1